MRELKLWIRGLLTPAGLRGALCALCIFAICSAPAQNSSESERFAAAFAAQDEAPAPVGPNFRYETFISGRNSGTIVSTRFGSVTNVFGRGVNLDANVFLGARFTDGSGFGGGSLTYDWRFADNAWLGLGLGVWVDEDAASDLSKIRIGGVGAVVYLGFRF